MPVCRTTKSFKEAGNCNATGIATPRQATYSVMKFAIRTHTMSSAPSSVSPAQWHCSKDFLTLQLQVYQGQEHWAIAFCLYILSYTVSNSITFLLSNILYCMHFNARQWIIYYFYFVLWNKKDISSGNKILYSCRIL